MPWHQCNTRQQLPSQGGMEIGGQETPEATGVKNCERVQIFHETSAVCP